MRETTPIDAPDGPPCPVCGAASTAVPAPGRAALLAAIENALLATGLDPLLPPVSGLQRCLSCTLEFAHPMQEPGAAFYQWLTTEGFAYHAARWEWTACRERLLALPRPQGRPLQLLDVGCGGGDFLRALADLDGVAAMGVEFNPDVVSAGRAHGLDLRLGGLAEATQAQPPGFDVITFWHVVEHIGDPVGLLLDARDALRPGGLLYFSVPLSPLSYEHAWFDPFNAPPHHLTRWNLPSLQALATRLGMSIELELPTAAPLAQRVLRSLVLQAMPMGITGGPWVKALRLCWFLLRHPCRLLAEIRMQGRRPQHEGRVLPDLAMICLRRGSPAAANSRGPRGE
jgi:SAM-dependent methyltransferase